MPASAAISEVNRSLLEVEGAVRLLKMGTPVNWPEVKHALGNLQKLQNKLLAEAKAEAA